MKNFNTQSSEVKKKERSHAKTFRIPISNGIFEHYGRLKDARWLLDLYVDWTTKEIPAPDGSRDGLVLGGKPIRDEDAAVPFRCCARTTRRWRQRLAHFGYISQLRTPLGYVIRVKKSKKWPDAPDKNVRSDRTKVSVHSKSELPIMSDQNYQVCPIRTTDHVRSNKDSAVQDRDEAEERTAAASPLRGKSEGVSKEAWEAIGIQICGTLKFTSAWVSVYDERPKDEPLSDAMERCIQCCQQTGIPVPRPFFEAKRRVERRETEDDSEISRIAGARGVREELMR